MIFIFSLNFFTLFHFTHRAKMTPSLHCPTPSASSIATVGEMCIISSTSDETAYHIRTHKVPNHRGFAITFVVYDNEYEQKVLKQIFDLTKELMNHHKKVEILMDHVPYFKAQILVFE